MNYFPGGNVLSLASSVICLQTFQYFQYMGTTTNAIGLDVVQFASPVDMRGSLQAVSADVYQELGLDLKRKYIKGFVELDVTDLFRSNSQDQIGFDNQRWQLVDEEEWFPMDGWDSFMAVRVESP